MKKLTIILLFVAQVLGTATNAFAQSEEFIPRASIQINCQCSYFNQDGIEKIILTAGESNSVTWEDIKGCHLEDGKVVNEEDKTSCWKAKMNASWNCTQSAQSTQPGRIRPPAVLLHEDSCYGVIELDEKRISDDSEK
jgi:hypothetical protein